MGTHLQLPPETLRQLRLKVREAGERRTALYGELHAALETSPIGRPKQAAHSAGRS